MVVDILEEPAGEVYQSLIDHAMNQCHQFLLVVRQQIDLQETGNSLLRSLEPYLVEQFETNKWPGTELFGHQATARYYRCDPAATNILQRAVNRLYAWRQPDYPEDLCFLKVKRVPWLATITHEHDGYFEIERSDVDLLTSAVPGLRLRFKR